MSNELSVVVSSARDASPDDLKFQSDLQAALQQAGFAPLVLPHLYDLAPGDSGMATLQAIRGPIVLFSWLYPRAAYWVLQANGVGGRLGATSFLPPEEMENRESGGRRSAADGGRTLWCIDLRSSATVAPFVAEVERLAGEASPPAAAEPAAAAAGSWTPPAARLPMAPRWYPVVDFSRCNNCMECLNFCLFGVFGLDSQDWITVQQPDACRNGCPACARICPSGAIMFPQHANPVLAGNGASHGDGPKLDLSQLFGGDWSQRLAAAQRERELHQPPNQRPEGTPPLAADRLDRLVDGLDEMGP